ncbi:MAG: hypothetical protein ACRD6N_17910, partial [Pyrinomonadaceae bacterium]
LCREQLHTLLSFQRSLYSTENFFCVRYSPKEKTLPPVDLFDNPACRSTTIGGDDRLAKDS